MARIALDDAGPVYAVGDVHGHLDLLKGLEDQIFEDGATLAGTKRIVMLGDLIDRGPSSAQVLDHILAPLPTGWQRLAVAGNHEVTMLDALDDATVFERWLGFGGLETLGSYGIGFDQVRTVLGKASKSRALIEAHVPTDHIELLAALPVTIEIGNLVLCHAGPKSALEASAHSDHDLLWHSGARPLKAGRQLFVHGHVPVEAVEFAPGRINVDTGAYKSGTLSAVRLANGLVPKALSFSLG